MYYTRVLGFLLFVSWGAGGVAAAPTGKSDAQIQTRHTRLLDRLVSAYPDFLSGHNGKVLIWKDGTRMLFDDGTGQKSFSKRLNEPDLEDMFYVAYPRGHTGIPPKANADPGRVRYEPFFRKMYGESRAGVGKKLVPIKWLPSKQSKRVMVSSVNGVAAKLQKISNALDKLPRRFDKYLIPARRSDRKYVPGVFNWRCIRGTQRLSVHSFGAAIDLVFLQYWRTQLRKKGIKAKGTTDCRANQPKLPHGAQNFTFTYKNTMPWEIVDIFERHGFIWGGKWAHYDTMHFEYRPELLPVQASK